MADPTASRIPPALKCLLRTALHHLALLLAETLCMFLMLCFSAETGESDGSGFLPIDLYRPHPVLFPVGTALLIAAYLCAWYFLLKGDLKECLHFKPGWTVGWVLLWLVSRVAALAVWVTVMIFSIGLFSSMRPEIAEGAVPIYLAAALIYSAADAVITFAVRKDTN